MKKVSEIHPELFHYTTWSGVKGILDTNALWASHIKYLNDSSEYRLAEEFLRNRLIDIVRLKISELCENHRRIRSYVDSNGGLEFQTSEMARDMVVALYKTTGEDFYVVSFCGTPEDPYEKQNGLLSQWRGYSGTMGFCIVFEASKIELALEREYAQFHYLPSHISDVVYHHQHAMLEEELGEYFNDLREFVGKTVISIAERGAAPDGAKAMTAFHVISTRVKHRAFFEEKEIRIVAAPLVHRQTLQKLKESSDEVQKPEKDVRFRPWRNFSAPYIELFGRNFDALPIKRIIVGPGLQRDSAVMALKSLINDRKIDIVRSELPYF